MAGRIIAAVGTKGGVGKSTIAVHAAAWLAERGDAVVFLDADPSRSGSMFLADAAPSIPIELAEDPDAVLDAVPALAERFAFVVVDAPAGLAESSRAVLLIADVALLPTGPSVLDLRALADTARIVRQAQSIRRGPPRVVVVLNRLRRGTLLAADAVDAAAALGLPVAETTIGERIGLADCAGQGRLAWHFRPAIESAAELVHLFEETIGTDGTT